MIWLYACPELYAHSGKNRKSPKLLSLANLEALYKQEVIENRKNRENSTKSKAGSLERFKNLKHL